MKDKQMQQEDPNVFVNELAQDVPPEKLQKLETASAAITQMVYDPRTKTQVKSMMKQGEIQETLPKTANAVFQNFESMSRSKMGDMPLDIKLALGVHTFNEVKDMAASMGVAPEMDLQEAQPLLKEALQLYIRKGLKEKTIDPIELQENINPLLTQSEREEGEGLAGQFGIPTGLQPEQANQGLLEKKMQPLQLKQQQLMKENQGMQSALQGIAGGGE